MSIGIKKEDMVDGLIKPDAARLCEDCFCVVAAEKCPLCKEGTVPHPEREQELWYCIGCGDEIAAADVQVIPWTHDPYRQDEEGGLCCLCPDCAAEE